LLDPAVCRWIVDNGSLANKWALAYMGWLRTGPEYCFNNGVTIENAVGPAIDALQ
jgi:hypothetical protein